MTSHRLTCLAGVLVMASGCAMSAFARTGPDLILAAGAVVGCGQGLVANPAVLAVTGHYAGTGRLGAAVGVLFASMALAGIAAPLAVAGALQASGGGASRDCILAYALFVASGALGTVLMAPPPDQDASRWALKAEDAGKETAAGDGRSSKCAVLNFLRAIEWTLLLDPVFLLLAAGTALSFTCLLNFYYLLPQAAAALDRDGAAPGAGLLSIVSAVDLVARFFFGWLGDCKVPGLYLCNINSSDDSSYCLTIKKKYLPP